MRSTSSTPFAADPSVCFCLPFGKNLTFVCVLAMRSVSCVSSDRGAIVMPISLPKPIASYFASEKAEDASALARCFSDHGVVRDEGGTFTGRAAIARWNADARAKYHHTVVPLSATESDGVIVVLAS